jgi:hypothetical protein
VNGVNGELDENRLSQDVRESNIERIAEEEMTTAPDFSAMALSHGALDAAERATQAPFAPPSRWITNKEPA